MPAPYSPFALPLSDSERAFVDAITSSDDVSITWSDTTMTVWRGDKSADFNRPLGVPDVARVKAAKFRKAG